MEKDKHFLISIVVPIYNVEKYLERCVNSILLQSYKYIEVILVNDGSTDRSPVICNEFANKDDRVKVIHKVNGGLSDARNFGIKQARGEYILFIDSDDYIELDTCREFIKALNNKEVDIIVGNAKKIEGSKITYFTHTNLIERKEYNSKEFISKSIKAGEWYAPVWLNMYRREFILKNSLYFKKGILHEDIDILPRLFLTAKNIVYIDYCFYNYDIRIGSITQMKSKKKNIESVKFIYTEWKAIFDRVENLELRKLLYGALVKQYLFASREFNILEKNYLNGINSKFLFKYALNIRERIKVIFYCISPWLYNNYKKSKGICW